MGAEIGIATGMAVRSVKDMPATRRIGMSWMLVTAVGSVLCGIAGLAYVTRTGLALSDPETIFIAVARFDRSVQPEVSRTFDRTVEAF